MNILEVLRAVSTMVPAARFLGLGALFLSRRTDHILVTGVLSNEHVVRRWGVRNEGAVEHSSVTSGTALTSQGRMATIGLSESSMTYQSITWKDAVCMSLGTATVLTSPVRGVCLVVGILLRSQPIIAFGMCSELTHATCEVQPKVCTPAKVAGRSFHNGIMA